MVDSPVVEDPPESEVTQFQKGRIVQLDGLAKAAQHNGKLGYVVGVREDGRVAVELVGVEGQCKLVGIAPKPANCNIVVHTENANVMRGEIGNDCDLDGPLGFLRDPANAAVADVSDAAVLASKLFEQGLKADGGGLVWQGNPYRIDLPLPATVAMFDDLEADVRHLLVFECLPIGHAFVLERCIGGGWRMYQSSKLEYDSEEDPYLGGYSALEWVSAHEFLPEKVKAADGGGYAIRGRDGGSPCGRLGIAHRKWGRGQILSIDDVKEIIELVNKIKKCCDKIATHFVENLDFGPGKKCGGVKKTPKDELCMWRTQFDLGIVPWINENREAQDYKLPVESLDVALQTELLGLHEELLGRKLRTDVYYSILEHAGHAGTGGKKANKEG